MIETDLAERIVEWAADRWQADPRANGRRPGKAEVELQVWFHPGLVGHRPPYWRAACAARPARMPKRWRAGQGESPQAALRALASELRAR